MGTVLETAGGPLAVWEADLSTASTEYGPVLVSLVDGDVSERALRTACALATDTDAPLIVLNVVRVPEQTPLSLPAGESDEHREQTNRALDSILDIDPDVGTHGAVHVGHHLVHIVNAAVDQYGVSTVVADESWETSRAASIVRPPLERLAQKIACPVVLPTGRPLPETVPSILVPVAGGPHSRTATDVARSIALARDAHVELLHVATPDTDPDRATAEYLRRSRRRLQSLDDVDTWLLERENPARAIVEQSRYYKVTVIGAPRSSRLRRFIFGSTARSVRESAGNSVLTVWR